MNNFAFGLILAIGAATIPAQAASDIQANPSTSQYLQDSRGIVVRSGQGLCWRTGHWTPNDAIPGCDGELVPPITKATAPAIIPPNQPAQVPATTVATPVPPCDFVTSLGSDETFPFNQATLNSAARKRIDEVLLEIGNCTQVDAILVTGHTDRLGSEQYNRRLSEKRAQAVAQYLTTKGVSTKVNTAGAGKSEPVKECSNKLSRSQLVQCLAPNRRVVIEVRGTAKPLARP